MADYYPVLKRAISSLPSSSGDARRIVYEKARAALLKQLQSYDPPLSPSDVTEQRLALEECIRRIEGEVAGAAFGLPNEAPVQAAPPPPQPEPPRPPLQPEPRVEVRRPEAPPPPPPVATVQKPLPQVTARTEPPRSPPPAPPPPKADPKIGAGISALSNTLRQADQLGGASAQAVRTAREAIEEPVEPSAPGEKIEPNFLDAPLGGRASTPIDPVPAPPPRRSKPLPPRPDPAARARTTQPPKRRSAVPILEGLLILIVIGGAVGAYFARDQLTALWDSYMQPAPTAAVDTATPPAAGSDGLEPKIVDRLPQDGEASPVAPDARPVQTTEVAPSADIDFPPADGVDQPDAATAPDNPPVETAQPDAATPEVTTPEPGAPEPATPATPDTATPVAPATPATPEPTTPAVMVAQRAILYEEPIPGSEGARVEGRVTWSVVNEPVLPGEPPVPQVRAVVEVPERDMSLTLSIRENADAALPASHIVEAKFNLPPNFPGTSIDTTPGLILKPTEDARGDALVGAVAKVADNLFWVALSGSPAETEKNLALLRDGQWIDVPIRYGNRRRAILTFEKGPPGDQVIREALQAWSN